MTDEHLAPEDRFRVPYIERVLAKAKEARCQDCFPDIFVVPQDGVWMIIVRHAVTCPSYHQEGPKVTWSDL